jgi:hypothetical protein
MYFGATRIEVHRLTLGGCSGEGKGQRDQRKKNFVHVEPWFTGCANVAKALKYDEPCKGLNNKATRLSTSANDA